MTTSIEITKIRGERIVRHAEEPPLMVKARVTVEADLYNESEGPRGPLLFVVHVEVSPLDGGDAKGVHMEMSTCPTDSVQAVLEEASKHAFTGHMRMTIHACVEEAMEFTLASLARWMR